GSTVTYTVTVRNGDSSPCPTGLFTLSSTQPSGWTTSFSATSLTLAPGKSGSVTMSKVVPTTGTDGQSFTIIATAAQGSLSGSMLTNLQITSLPDMTPPSTPIMTTIVSTSPTAIYLS